jgi:hypothetical protein
MMLLKMGPWAEKDKEEKEDNSYHYPKPNWTLESHRKERQQRIKKFHQTIHKTCGKI